MVLLYDEVGVFFSYSIESSSMYVLNDSESGIEYIVSFKTYAIDL